MTEDSNKPIIDTQQSGIASVDFDAPGFGGSTAERSADQGVPNSHPNLSSTTAAYTAARSNHQRSWWHSQFNLMLAVFSLLAVAALLFVSLAPDPSVKALQTQATSKERLPESAAPWSMSQLADARSKSQEILQNLLQSKKSLEQKGVTEWAPEEYAAALQLAEAGDEAYKSQDFELAIQSYQQAVDDMDALFDFLPRQISSRLSEANAALKDGKVGLAREKFTLVQELDNGNIDAARGLDATEQLAQALELKESAQNLEQAFARTGSLDDLISAEQQLVQAKQLAAGYVPLQAALARVQSSLAETRYKSAMSKAYQALFAARYASARAAFAEALKIKPEDAAAKRGLQQSLASDQNASIASLLAQAQRFEQNEEWGSAQSNYQTVLQRDANQVSAKLGQIRSGARLALDQQLQQVLADPLALSRSDARSKAQNILQDAQNISNRGPRLDGQISSLESALAQADAPINVRFRSDNATQVTLQKVGSKPIQLGQFAQKNLALKPGRYVATGVRLGFQDVRKTIELAVTGAAVQEFTVQCDQSLAANASAGG